MTDTLDFDDFIREVEWKYLFHNKKFRLYYRGDYAGVFYPDERWIYISIETWKRLKIHISIEKLKENKLIKSLDVERIETQHLVFYAQIPAGTHMTIRTL